MKSKIIPNAGRRSKVFDVLPGKGNLLSTLESREVSGFFIRQISSPWLRFQSQVVRRGVHHRPQVNSILPSRPDTFGHDVIRSAGGWLADLLDRKCVREALSIIEVESLA